MSTFKDSEGREWDIVLHLGTKAKIKSRTGVNFNDALRKPEFLTELVGDPYLFFSVLCVAVEGQLKERKITEEQFGESLSDEDVVGSAVKAFVEASIESFPKGQRQAFKAAFKGLWSSTTKLTNAMEKELIDKIEGIDFDALAEKLLSTSSSSAGESPASSEESIIGSSHSANSST